MSFRFSIVGDSNIQRHMSPLNCRDRPLMSGAQVIPCGRLVILAESLRSVKAESNVCVLACVTNFLTRSLGVSATVGVHVEPILKECLETIRAACLEQSDAVFLLCPPMYRSTPGWYRDAMPEVLQKFSEVMKMKPPNLLLMPSFPTPSYEADGVHLTAYSGLEYVIHLFDSAVDLLSSVSLDQDGRNSKTCETTRVLEDRMVALEQDHRRLNREFESKSVIDSELACYHENIRFEDHFVIQGLARLPELSPKEWQVRALQDVKIALGLFIDTELPILYVQNVTGIGKNATVTYQVRMSCVDHSKQIRTKFSGFFLGGKNTLPPALKGVSIRNRISKATSVRISLLRLIGQRHVDANPGSNFKVLGYVSRPLLKIFPAANSKDQRVRTYNYIEAIKNLPNEFQEPELEEILRKISPKLKGKLRQTFGIINDDMLRRAFRNQGRSDVAGDDQAEPEDEDGDGQAGDGFVRPGYSRKRGAAGGSGTQKAAKSSKSSKSGKN